MQKSTEILYFCPKIPISLATMYGVSLLSRSIIRAIAPFILKSRDSYFLLVSLPDGIPDYAKI